jgi:hypothetical protein
MQKAAALEKVADPYTMNQTRTQPRADEYVIGDPSTFAEDVHSPNTWETEYSGDNVRRNEIGMPEMRGDTFNHPEKTASKEVLLKKADLCIAVAQLMMDKTASEEALEDQSVALMHLPDQELIDTHKRLAGDDEDGDDDDDKGQQGQQQDDKDQKQQDKQAAATKEMADRVAQQILTGDFGAAQQQVQELVQQAQQQQQVQEQVEQQAQQDQQVQEQVEVEQQGQDQQVQDEQVQQVSQQVQQMIEQAMQNQQQPQQQGQQMLPPADVIQTDEQVLDDMLAEAGCQTAEADIEMLPAQMDVTVDDLGPEDEVLRQLFAQDDDEKEQDKQSQDQDQDKGKQQQKQQGQQQQDKGQQQKQQKQAAAPGVIRTAATRTVGTRPTEGVSKLGGTSASGGGQESIDQLSNLWKTAPDVRDAFGLK